MTDAIIIFTGDFKDSLIIGGLEAACFRVTATVFTR